MPTVEDPAYSFAQVLTNELKAIKAARTSREVIKPPAAQPVLALPGAKEPPLLPAPEKPTEAKPAEKGISGLLSKLVKAATDVTAKFAPSLGQRLLEFLAMGLELIEKEVPNPEAEALQMDLIGLALSGGGIRSATFSLGILQGLSDKGLLRHIDYLSTVSGGGYIGSWLISWIHNTDGQNAKAKFDRVQESLQSAQKGSTSDRLQAIHNLRRYSNYLTPNVSFF